MYRIFITKFFLFFVAVLFLGKAVVSFGQENQPKLIRPVRELFSHPKHESVFKEMGKSCIDCHNFSIHDVTSGPLSKEISGGYLKPAKQICHQCHLGKISMPRPNQCQLCHSDVHALMPSDHSNNWRMRHGAKAQFDKDSCTQCHSQKSCAECHAKRDTLNPIVHPANFRLMHSIQARMDPQRCAQCHQTASFCVNCHTGARK